MYKYYNLDRTKKKILGDPNFSYLAYVQDPH